jgi:hypothetical protein
MAINYYVCQGACPKAGNTYANDPTCGGGCGGQCTCDKGNVRTAQVGGNGLLNTNLRDEYSVLGGVVAPKRSAYTITGMQNPLAQRPTKKLDRSLPSLRDNSAVSRFNDFNPYNVSPRKSREVIQNTMQMRKKGSNVVYKVNVNTFQPTGSPVISKRFSR